MLVEGNCDSSFAAFSTPVDTGILDSGSSATILKSAHCDYVRNIKPSARGVSTAENGGSLSISGEGSAGTLDNVLIADNIRESVISISHLADKGINTLFTKTSVQLFSDSTGMEIARGERDKQGLYRIPLDSVFYDDFVGNLGSTCPDVDPLTLLHKRTGYSYSD